LSRSHFHWAFWTKEKGERLVVLHTLPDAELKTAK
jgi:hypothetical protein